MNQLRSALHLLWIAITAIPWATAALLMSPFVSRDRLYRFCIVWAGWVVGSGRVLLGIRNRVHGLENLSLTNNQPAILLVKHQSAWETFSIATLVPQSLAYVLKRELVYIPFFGWTLARLRMIYIDRSQSIRAFSKIVAQGRRALEEGTWIVMFPEGTRVPRGQAGQYHASGALLAIECGVPVIPVAVASARCWPKGRFTKQPGTVDFSFGPPIQSEGRKARELMKEVETWIEAEMRRLDPDAYPAARDAAAD